MKHYFYSEGKKRKGPFTFEQLKNENIGRDTLIWFEGLADWKPAKEIKELENVFQLTPPPIRRTKTELNTINNVSEKINEESTIDNDNTEYFTPKKRGMFLNPFSFEGRIRRTEYGISLIIFSVTFRIILTVIQLGYGATILGLAYIPML